MEPILPRGFADPERQMAQALAMERATSKTDDVLRQYAARTDTFGGRYVCADTMKELMPGYAQSRESRNALNVAVHNSASVLSAEQFRRVVGQGFTSDSNVAVFITGIPGAGKSTAVETAVARNAAVVFEGQLSRPAPSFDKIDRALKAGFDVHIMAVHVPPEVALERTNARFTSSHNGRGASIAVMAEIQGNLPAGLNQIRQKFGEAVHLVAIDNTPKQERLIEGWQGALPIWRKQDTVTKSSKDFTPPSTQDTEKVATAPSSTSKLQDAAPAQSWAQRVGQQVIGASIRMRTEPEFREEIQKKTH